MKYFKGFLFYCLVLVSLSLSGKGSFSGPRKQFAYHNWQRSDGLPQNSVSSIVQTTDGYIWLGTQEGLVRFDGINFTVFNKENTREIKSNWITDLSADTEGGLWISAHDGGIIQYKNGSFTHYGKKQGMSDEMVLSVHADGRGRVWGSTFSNGIYLIEKGKVVKHYTKENGLVTNSINDIIDDPEGNLWIAFGTGGVASLKDGRFTFYGESEGLATKRVRKLYVDRKGRLWAGTHMGISLFEGGRFVSYGVEEGFVGGKVVAMLEDRRGNFWVATYSGGLQLFKDGRFRKSFSNRVTSQFVRALYEDLEGNIWVGSQDEGLTMLRDCKFRFLSPETGLSSDMITAVFGTADGRIFAGTWGDGLNIIKNGRVVKIFGKEELMSKMVTSVIEDSRGRIWVGSLTYGLRLLDGENSRVYDESNGMKSNLVFSVVEISNGDIYVGTAGGLTIISPDGMRHLTKENGLYNDRVRWVKEDSEGRVWVVSELGINVLKDGKPAGLEIEKKFDSKNVWAVYEGPDGTMWMATDGDGLILYHKGKIHSFTKKDGLIDDRIYAIMEDNEGNLWISCNRGVSRVSRSKLIKYAEGSGPLPRFYSHSIKKGTVDVEFNGGFQYPAWKDEHGMLWFSTTKGLAVIDPGDFSLNGYVPPIHLEKMVVDRVSMDLRRETVLQPGTRELEFHYSGLSYADPKEMRFRYRLDGFDTSWIEAGNRRAAYYMNLEPGSYRFRVEGANSDGVWNRVGESRTFVIKPFFYQTIYFRTVALLAFLTMLYFVYRYKFRSMEEEKKELIKRVVEAEKKYERCRIGEDKAQYYIEMLHEYMEGEKPYRDNAITLQKIAEELKVSHLYLSQIINTYMDRSYYSFINSYRIEEMKQALADPARADENILSVAYEAGFNSKSTFNTLFKKETGLTPTQYRKKYLKS